LTETQTTEPLVPEPIATEVEMAIEKLKRHESQGINQIPGELIKAGGKKFRYEIYKLINSDWNKEELPKEWKKSINLAVYKRATKRIVVIIGHINFSNDIQNFIQHPLVKVDSICIVNYWGSSMWISTQQVIY
jgi:hypothetical protein